VTFQSLKAGAPNFFWKTPASTAADEEQLTASENPQSPGSWSRDGETLAFAVSNPSTGRDIWTLSLKNGRRAMPFLDTRFDEVGPEFSPDGRWIAYESNESGREEVYVAPFPGPGR
jgi:Tol biopolymer transport system component